MLWIVALLLVVVVNGGTTCTSNSYSPGSPLSTHSCDVNATTGTTYTMEHFENVTANAMYECPASGKRIIISNGIPNHMFTYDNTTADKSVICSTNWWIEVPLNPVDTGTKVEPSPDGLIAMSASGIPIFGNQPSGSSLNYSDWDLHGINEAGMFHYLAVPGGDNSSDLLLGYALDGFPIYGTVDDDSVLDSCNGRTVNGVYRYHARKPTQVDYSGAYCNANGVDINYDFIIGCYKGDLSSTVIGNYLFQTLPDDCGLILQQSNNPERLGFSLNTTTATSPPTLVWTDGTSVNVVSVSPDETGTSTSTEVGLVVGLSIIAIAGLAITYYYQVYLKRARTFSYVKIIRPR